jgi:hypothetical protein
MLHRTPFRFTVYNWAKWLFWIATAVNIIAAALIKMPERPEFGAVYTEIAKAGAAHGWWLVILATAVIGITSAITKSIGSPDTLETLHELLDSLHAAVFKGPEYSIPDEHKVTIFKAVKTCPQDHWLRRMFGFLGTRARWLKPVVRSGHTSQDTTTCFRLYDDADKCEGVAGQAWARNRVITVYDLPSVSQTPYNYQVAAYASRSYVSEDRVRAKKPKSRSVLGMPILVKGELWGVLVFDSRNPAKIRYEEIEEMYRVISRHLNTLIAKHL